MDFDPYILAFSAATVIVTIWMGFWSAKRSKTAHDFYVAGRSVSVGWNASAISGEYLSAASFMGVAGMVMSSGYDALWYPVCYACGYLFLLLFIAGPLRRFGAYTIPDFAEGRFDSPVFRKIAVVFVLFIGFFYTMPQMKGAGTTLAYIFPGLPYWAGVVLVGAVITLNVALGGMKGITLVQAFQYWAKMFAISAPIFVLMTVYGHYGKQVGFNNSAARSEAIRLPASIEWVETTHADTVSRFDSRLDRSSGVSTWTRVRRWWAGYQRKGSPNPAAYVFRPSPVQPCSIQALLTQCTEVTGTRYLLPREVVAMAPTVEFGHTNALNGLEWVAACEDALQRKGNLALIRENARTVYVVPEDWARTMTNAPSQTTRVPLRPILPGSAPSDSTWLNPFGPLTTKAAKAAAALQQRPRAAGIPLRPSLQPEAHLTVNLNFTNISQALAVYADLTGREVQPRTNDLGRRFDELLGGQLSRWQLLPPPPSSDSGLSEHHDGVLTATEAKQAVETFFRTNGIAVLAEGERYLRVAAGPGPPAREEAGVAQERRYALLYTYSLIIALVCGTAGLPHILVRFYTNPDGVAAKKTTMWVMILIGVFYLFPPVFGVMGRNLLPELYATTGAKGTDKVVLELPKVLDRSAAVLSRSNPDAASQALTAAAEDSRAPKKSIPWGSILSGITCAGAFAAFMSTFSGLLVSMTGALAHDVYGRMLNPKSTPPQRLRAFKIAAVVIGGVAILLGTFVEPLQINFMVGQAFAIAAASYFPLLFVSCWWRRLTMKGAAAGMLTGGICAVTAVTLTNFSDLGWLKLGEFWAGYPLLRILCEQPAIWCVPLAIGLMVAISKLTTKEVPSDIRMKMLVLHAPEKLGLKQEYIQEHQSH